MQTSAIRPIEPRDYASFARLADQLGYPVEVEFVRAQLEREQKRDDCATLVYENPSGIVGWVACRVVERAYRTPYGEVAGLVVDQAHRSRGYGAELLAAAEEWFRSRQVPEVLVRSNQIRTQAHRFYDREGYSRTKVQQVFSKVLTR